MIGKVHMNRTLVVISSVVALALLGTSAFYKNDDVSPAAIQEIPSPQIAARAPQNPVTVLAERPIVAGPGEHYDQSRRLLTSFNRAQSYRAFLFEAIKHPEQGGYMYAYEAFGACGVNSSQVEPVRQPVGINATARQREAADLYKARCDITAADRAAATLQLTAVRGPDMQSDPLMQISFAYLKAKSPAEKKEVMAAALRSNDPLLIRTVVPQQVSGDGVEPGSVRLLGTDYRGKQGEELAGYAMDLTACQLGMDCSRNSIRALQLCADRGWCGDSVEEALRSGLDKPEGVNMHEVEQLTKAIVEAIKKKDASALVR
ncbi:hypothetical protein KY495_12940 [Massilia sp. PAMC28688]|uniref:hypothetical protein n=1 Tax=Massilia sp. PAMC28688 TaxID=2861283 RepID=UPI001C6335A1|nr:hypothetical protein [Massilia sp. PAMC28688]QYF91708.1 hypothetical protein KY495_12940 [Massilia sp. PAMC28688]